MGKLLRQENFLLPSFSLQFRSCSRAPGGNLYLRSGCDKKLLTSLKKGTTIFGTTLTLGCYIIACSLRTYLEQLKSIACFFFKFKMRSAFTAQELTRWPAIQPNLLSNRRLDRSAQYPNMQVVSKKILRYMASLCFNSLRRNKTSGVPRRNLGECLSWLLSTQTQQSVKISTALDPVNEI